MLKKKLRALIYARTHQDAVEYADEPGVEEQISRAMDMVSLRAHPEVNALIVAESNF